jgi:hypothetical protein
MRLKLISCEVIYREMCDAIAHSPHQVDAEFLSKGLHDRGGKAMACELQERVDVISKQNYDFILFGYALCGNGLAGVRARNIPLVAPKGHDCITMLMGNRRRFEDYFESHPGTYFRSTGWIERGQGIELPMQDRTGAGMSYDDLVAKYGAENADFLNEELNRYKMTYKRLTYIQTGLEPDDQFVKTAEAEATQKGWKFEVLSGSLKLFRKLVSGDWNADEFIVVPPGGKIVPSYDENVMGWEPGD